eukprot:1142098-Pelagomonas_calceolata.AAC.2
MSAGLNNVNNDENAFGAGSRTSNGSRLTDLELQLFEIIQREAASVNLSAEEKSRLRELGELVGSRFETISGEASSDASGSAEMNGQLSDLEEDPRDGGPEIASGEASADSNSAEEIDGIRELEDLLGGEPGLSNGEEEGFIDLDSGPFQGFFTNGG